MKNTEITMRCLYLVMALAQSSLPPYTSLLSAGPSTPWKGVSVQLTCERPVLLRSFFSDAEFVVSELQVGNVIAAGARARLLGCASEYGKSQGLPAPPPCHLLRSLQRHPALLLHHHCWPCCELIQLKNLQKKEMISYRLVQFRSGAEQWEQRWMGRAIVKPHLQC